MAYYTVELSAGLCTILLRWQSREDKAVRQYIPYYACCWPLAWRGVDIRGLGRRPRSDAGCTSALVAVRAQSPQRTSAHRYVSLCRDDLDHFSCVEPWLCREDSRADVRCSQLSIGLLA